ncbi:MAG: hypothetical protein Q9166_006431 [cf. Caloplaca sp. 2 TL-2023]
MPYENDWRGRCNRPSQSNRAYGAARDAYYPDQSGFDEWGHPGRDKLDGYVAQDGRDAYKDKQKAGATARNDYTYELDRAYNSVRGMQPNEARYYRTATGGITRLDHSKLKPLASNWSQMEVEQAVLDFYGRSPYMYQTADGARRHHDHITSHYRDADYAEGQVAYHSHYEHDPTSTARDPYGREVPHDAQPYNYPYPATDLPPGGGYYSTHQGSGGKTYTESYGKQTQERKVARRL